MNDSAKREDFGPSGRAHFALVRVRVVGLDWLYLRAAGHRRARFQHRSAEGWDGSWLAP